MNTSDVNSLSKARKLVFAILLKRIRQLHFSQRPPKSFYVGQQYVEDKQTAECMIGASFIFPGEVPQFDFMIHEARIVGDQHQNTLVIRIYRRIPRRLWEDLKYIGEGESFIVGYLASYMPRINRALMDNRYNQGHLLSRTFAIFEATEIVVIVGPEMLLMNWPIAFSPFPPSAAIASTINALFVRDFIDAMGSYFRGEFDDCIRRLITSAENFVRARGWRAKTIPNGCWRKLFRLKPRTTSVSFRHALRENLDLTQLSGQVINENLQLIYSTRNKIVHSGFRMSSSSEVFCSKAIGTLKYLIYRYCGDPLVSRYVYTLHMQFDLQCSVFGSKYNLDVMKRRDLSLAGGGVINTHADLERVMFESLRYNDRDKQSISR
jgi:hypothetical protein